MGDRGNVLVSGVYLYTHWGGTELPETVQQALSRKMRWDDDAYLTRIIFDQMTQGCQGEETGFGIATDPPDNEHSIVVVDCGGQRVTYDAETDGGSNDDRSWSFDEFVEATPAEIAFR